MDAWDEVNLVLNNPSSTIQSKLEAESKYWNNVNEGFVGPVTPADLKSYLLQALDSLVSPETPTIRMLDFGCGIGRAYTALSPQCHYYGADISESFLKIAHNRCPNAHLVLLKSQNLPFLSGYFDLAIAYSVLTHIALDDQCEFILSELHRVLKPKGVLLVSVFINAPRPAPNWITYTEESWSQLVNKIGFHIHKLTMVKEDNISQQSLYTLIK